MIVFLNEKETTLKIFKIKIMNKKYNFRRATNSNDIKNLCKLFDKVFYPEKVGELTNIFSKCLPGMKNDYWFIAEEKDNLEIVSAFALIPWNWEIAGIRLKIAEMGIVGTNELHRGKGLMRILNTEFDNTLVNESYDIAVIQGIPGFYHKFGYRYAIPMENHINLDINHIKEDFNSEAYSIRIADLNDLHFLMGEDEKYRKTKFVSVYREKKNWEYLLTHSRNTEYGSDYLVIENDNEKYYSRLPFWGFGKGLCVSEISENVPELALKQILYYLKQKAIEQAKPFIRINLLNESSLGELAMNLGAEKSKSYAWQVKIVDRINFLRKIIPIMECRLNNSDYKNLSEVIRLDLYSEAIDIEFKNGKIVSIGKSSNSEIENTFCIPSDLFDILILGHRSWEELQFVRPDIAPASLYLNPELNFSEIIVGKIIDVLFLKENSWVYVQY